MTSDDAALPEPAANNDPPDRLIQSLSSEPTVVFAPPVYTFTSAHYANAEHTAAIAVTAEAGPVALSLADTPIQWAALVASGLPISPYVVPTEPVPTAVSAFQAKAALVNAEHYEAADAAANATGGLVLLAWQTATEFQRTSPTIAALASTIGLSDAKVDELFISAAKIKA